MKNLLFIFSLLVSTNLLPFGMAVVKLGNNTKTVLKTTALLTAAYYSCVYGTKAYNYILTKIDEKSEKEIVRLIELQFKLNPQCNDQELRDKAWSINLRKCILDKLDQIDSSDPRWSQNFQDALSKLQKSFKTFDTVRSVINTVTVHVLENNREKEYDKPYEELSYFDQYLVHIIVNNTLLKYKPNNECSASEKAKKIEMEASSERINKILKNDLLSFAAKAAVSTAAGAFMTFIL
ncbi:MAG: hypothetical protein P4L22_06400 [Candidatus Babeliales bacterium]|nr:hypothetical protein [Candidatus Babeliales bacterium]